MYYVGNFWGQTFVYKTDDESVMFGPFESGNDAHFVVEMLNSGKLKLELGSYAKEDTKDTQTVY